MADGEDKSEEGMFKYAAFHPHTAPRPLLKLVKPNKTRLVLIQCAPEHFSAATGQGMRGGQAFA